MGQYTIYVTEQFQKIFLKLDRSEQLWINKIKGQLEESSTGKALRYSWLREKKVLNKRLYFFVAEEEKKILLVAYGSKKEQQKTIVYLIENRRYFQECLLAL